jgi:hypothetical protein
MLLSEASALQEKEAVKGTEIGKSRERAQDKKDLQTVRRGRVSEKPVAHLRGKRKRGHDEVERNPFLKGKSSRRRTATESEIGEAMSEEIIDEFVNEEELGDSEIMASIALDAVGDLNDGDGEGITVIERDDLDEGESVELREERKPIKNYNKMKKRIVGKENSQLRKREEEVLNEEPSRTRVEGLVVQGKGKLKKRKESPKHRERVLDEDDLENAG